MNKLLIAITLLLMITPTLALELRPAKSTHTEPGTLTFTLTNPTENQHTYRISHTNTLQLDYEQEITLQGQRTQNIPIHILNQNIPPGTYTELVTIEQITADQTSQVAAQPAVAHRITYRQLAETAVLDLSYSTTPLQRNQPLTITTHITNNGKEQAEATIRTQITQDSQIITEQTTQYTILEEEIINDAITFIPQQGTYTLTTTLEYNEETITETETIRVETTLPEFESITQQQLGEQMRLDLALQSELPQYAYAIIHIGDITLQTQRALIDGQTILSAYSGEILDLTQQARIEIHTDTETYTIQALIEQRSSEEPSYLPLGIALLTLALIATYMYRKKTHINS